MDVSHAIPFVGGFFSEVGDYRAFADHVFNMMT